MTVQLNIEARDASVKAQKIREGGNVPAIFYGPKEEATPVAVNAAEFLRVWNEAGSSTIVDLEGVGDNKEVLIHEVETHPVTGAPVHIDFYCIERGKKLTVTVPFSFVGEAPAEKLGGIVVKVMHELEIEVRPRDIPHEIEVDLTALTDLESAITVADLPLAEGIEPTAEPTETVVSITQAKEEVEEEARDISDIEIEGEKKEEEPTEDNE